MAPAEVEAQDAVRFQHYIFQSQFPQDCSTTTGVLTRAGLKGGQEHWPGDYFYGLGLGSQMASLKFNFAKALLSGRVYHFPTSHYVNLIRCASQTFDCYPIAAALWRRALQARRARATCATAPWTVRRCSGALSCRADASHASPG